MLKKPKCFKIFNNKLASDLAFISETMIIKSKYIFLTGAFVLVLIFGLTLSVGTVFAVSWPWEEPPSLTPPNSCDGDTKMGCNPPINVSGLYQTKSGGLGAGFLLVAQDANVGGRLGVGGTTTPQQTIDIVANGAYGLNGIKLAYGNTAKYNYFFGDAGNSTMTGAGNTAIGSWALRQNTTGTYNTANGQNALGLNTTGYRNTANGWQALFSNTTGYYNTVMGYLAGRSISTGNANTFLGSSAGYNASQKANAVNSMALGNGAFTTADNQIVIGNTAVTQTLLNGNVGIGTTNPQGRLHVAGDGAGYVLIGGSSSCGNNYAGISLNGQPFSGCANYNILSSPTDQNLFINRPAGSAIYFRENNGTQMTIDSGGRVVISGLLHVGDIQYTPGQDLNIRQFGQGNVTFFGNTQTTSYTVRVGASNDTVRSYLQIDSESGPPTSDCTANSQRGRIVHDYANNRLYVCGGATRGWDWIALNN